VGFQFIDYFYSFRNVARRSSCKRGVLLVKEKEEESLSSNLRRMPLIVAEFVSYPIIWMFRKAR